MRTLFLLLALSLIFKSATATEKTYKAKPNKATVFLSGAQVTFIENVQIAAGQTELVFEGISPLQYGQTIDARGMGEFVIIDARYEVRYPNTNTPIQTEKQKQLQKQIKLLGDSIEEFDFMLQEINEKMQILTTEKNLLLNNRIIKGDFKKDSLELMKNGMEYLHVKLNQISTETFKLKKEQKKINAVLQTSRERVQHFEEMLNDTYANAQTVSTQNYCAIITVMANAATKGNIEFSYFSNAASWTPEYEIRTGTAQKLKLVSKARVRQSTGINWDQVALTLSTSTPNIGHQIPVLNPYYLSLLIHRTRVAREEADYDKRKSAAPATATGGALFKELEETKAEDYNNIPAQTLANYSAISENMISVDYNISIPINLTGNGKDYALTIKEQDMDASYTYYAVPKLDRNAFLMARVTGWESLNIIPGKARIYNDNSFVAENYLDTHNATDTLDINLGRDKTFEFKRTLIKNKVSEKTITDKTIKTYMYEIAFRNPKQNNIEIKVLDQLPVCFEKDVVVEALDITGAEIDKPSGLITWKKNLKAKESCKIKFGYTVTYQTSKPLAGL